MDNLKVYDTITEALKNLGFEVLGGSDIDVAGQNGIGTDYKLGDYEVKIVIVN